MKLVWHAEGLQERDWLREILGDLVSEEILDLSLGYFDDPAIHVISSNLRPLASYEGYFRECRSNTSRLYLVHLSDEWFSGGYAQYAYFDGVIRNFRTDLASGPGILTIPEGYSNGTLASKDVRPADQRKYLWSFTGEIKASRAEMVSSFADLKPSLLLNTNVSNNVDARRLSKKDFDALLGDTVFSPCPMGNVILETWRLYESLERGAIPLLETRPHLNYFDDLFGPNPLPKFESWKQARAYAEATFAAKPTLLAKQQELQAWWRSHKDQVRNGVCDLVNGKTQQVELERYARLFRNRVPVVHEVLRLLELSRHQSGASLRRRMLNPAGPLRRIWNESLRKPR